MKQVLCSIAHSIILLVILGYYYAINQVKKVLFLQHFLFFWRLLCKQFIFLMKIIRNPSFRWYELYGNPSYLFSKRQPFSGFFLVLLPLPRANETHFDQRQQTYLRKQVLLPLPRTQWNSFWSKAANMPLDAGFRCLRRGSNKISNEIYTIIKKS